MITLFDLIIKELGEWFDFLKIDLDIIPIEKIILVVVKSSNVTPV